MSIDSFFNRKSLNNKLRALLTNLGPGQLSQGVHKPHTDGTCFVLVLVVQGEAAPLWKVDALVFIAKSRTKLKVCMSSIVPLTNSK